MFFSILITVHFTDSLALVKIFTAQFVAPEVPEKWNTVNNSSQSFLPVPGEQAVQLHSLAQGPLLAAVVGSACYLTAVEEEMRKAKNENLNVHIIVLSGLYRKVKGFILFPWETWPRCELQWGEKSSGAEFLVAFHS